MKHVFQQLHLKAEDIPKLPRGWRPAQVQDIADVLKPGKLFDENSVLEEGDVPVVNQSADDWHGFHNEEPGVIANEEQPVSTFANHTCAMRLMKRSFSCIQNIFLRVGKSGICDTTFFHYATLGRVSLSGYKGHHPIYRAAWIPLPPLPQQVEIGRTISAYDDLIENNRRRMALLEEAARQLYREWFVRLRFPGHEHTRITNGVPEGWEKTTAFSAMEVLSGGTPRTAVGDYWDGEIPFYTPKDATDTYYVLQAERAITELGLKNCNSRLYDTNTVFISARGTVGKLNLASRPMAMSQSCYALIGKGHVSQLFLFCALKEAIEHFKQHAVGAVFDAIVVDTFMLIPFVVPAKKKVQHFEEAVTPMFRQLANLVEQNEKLRAARDLLLPRLMSGEIAI